MFWNILIPNTFQIFRFVFSILIARLLDPKDFGIIGIAGILIYYSDTLTNFGFSTALIQRKLINESHINSVFIINFLISILLTTMMVLLSNHISEFFNIAELDDVLKTLSITFILNTFYLIPVTIARRNVDFKIVSLAEFYGGISQSIIAILLAYFGFGYWALVYSLIAANIIRTIFINLKVKWRPKFRYSHQSIKDIFSFASWNFLYAQIKLIESNIDKLILVKYLGPIQLGYYDKAFSYSMMPIESLSNRISGVMFSAFSRNQDAKAILKDQFLRLAIVISIICFPIFIGFVSISRYFVIALLGEKWFPMIIPFQILSIAFIFNSLSNLMVSLNMGVGKYKKQIKLKLYYAIVLISLCVYFLKWGINIIALAVLISNVFMLFITFNLTRYTINVKWSEFLKALFPAIVVTGIMFLVVKMMSLYFVINLTLINLLILVFVGFITYLILIISINFEETTFLRAELKKRIFAFIKARK